MALLRTSRECEQGSHGCTIPFLSLCVHIHVHLGECSYLGIYMSLLIEQPGRHSSWDGVCLWLVLANYDGSAGQRSGMDSALDSKCIHSTILLVYVWSRFCVISGYLNKVPKRITNLTSFSTVLPQNYRLYFFLKILNHLRRVRFTTLLLSWPCVLTCGLLSWYLG